MRPKEEIMNDISKITEEGGIIFTPSLTLINLTFELLIDIRDMLHKDIAQIIEDLNFIAHKD